MKESFNLFLIFILYLSLLYYKDGYCLVFSTILLCMLFQKLKSYISTLGTESIYNDWKLSTQLHCFSLIPCCIFFCVNILGCDINYNNILILNGLTSCTFLTSIIFQRAHFFKLIPYIIALLSASFRFYFNSYHNHNNIHNSHNNHDVLFGDFISLPLFVWFCNRISEKSRLKSLKLEPFEYFTICIGYGICLHHVVNNLIMTINVNHHVEVEEEGGSLSGSLYEKSWTMLANGIVAVIEVGEASLSGNILHFMISFILVCILWLRLLIAAGGPYTILYNFLIEADNSQGLAVVLAWSAILCTLPLCSMIVRNITIPRIISRKLFHLYAIIMFLPAIILRSNSNSNTNSYSGNDFVSSNRPLPAVTLALAVGLCLLVLTEYVRAFCHKNGMKLLVQHIDDYFSLFVDARDKDRQLALTQIQLLVACALPVWLAAYTFDSSSSSRSSSSSSSSFLLSAASSPPIIAHLGWVVVGVGDGMAAVIGKTYGRHRWPESRSDKVKVSNGSNGSNGSGRTLEGSLAAWISSMFAAVIMLYYYHHMNNMNNMDSNSKNNDNSSTMTLTSFDWKEFRRVTLAITAATYSEACTYDADNVILPIITLSFYALY